MKNVLLFVLVSLMFSIDVSAQASGGQITRRRTNATAKTQKQSRGSKPRSNQIKPSSSNGNVAKISEPDGYINGHGYVDLELPSGTKWATCNIGANTPKQYGDYFAWGETTGFNSGKTDFSWRTYKWCNGSYDPQIKSNTDRSYFPIRNRTELNLEEDAACMSWGDAWRMPSIDQFEELVNSNYTITAWTLHKGVNGYMITSKKNGKSLFLPAAGQRYDSSLLNAGLLGYYWSRTLNTRDPDNARGLLFGKGGNGANDDDPYHGQSVRPVLL